MLLLFVSGDAAQHRHHTSLASSGAPLLSPLYSAAGITLIFVNLINRWTQLVDY